MVNDTISDLLTRIRNANLIKSETVSIPLTRINKQISEILEKQGFIESFQIVSPQESNGVELPIKHNLTSIKKNSSLQSSDKNIFHYKG